MERFERSYNLSKRLILPLDDIPVYFYIYINPILYGNIYVYRMTRKEILKHNVVMLSGYYESQGASYHF